MASRPFDAEEFLKTHYVKGTVTTPVKLTFGEKTYTLKMEGQPAAYTDAEIEAELRRQNKDVPCAKPSVVTAAGKVAQTRGKLSPESAGDFAAAHTAAAAPAPAPSGNGRARAPATA